MAEAHSKNHDYHIIDPSPWPIIASVSAFLMAIGAVTMFHDGTSLILIAGTLGVLSPCLAGGAMWSRNLWKPSHPCGAAAFALWHDPLHRL